MTKKDICSLIVQAIKNFLSTPDRLETFRAKNRFVRKRLLSMTHVIMFLLFSNSASLFTNLANFKREFCESASFPKRISKQALSHARQGINPQLFSELFNISVDMFYQNLPKRKTWHGFHVFAIDGSKFELTNSKSNFDYFGELFNTRNPNQKYTQALASVVYDVLDDYIVHASINKYLASERASAMQHLQTLERLGIYQNSVVVFDRGYYSEKMFRYCVSHGHLCVMRLKENYNFSKTAGKKKADFVSVLAGNSKEGTEDISIRIIAVMLDSGEYEYLATNIFDTSFTSELFSELYFLRWPVMPISA